SRLKGVHLNGVEVSLDWTFDDAYQLEQADWLVRSHWVKRWHGKQQVKASTTPSTGQGKAHATCRWCTATARAALPERSIACISTGASVAGKRYGGSVLARFKTCSASTCTSSGERGCCSMRSTCANWGEPTTTGMC